MSSVPSPTGGSPVGLEMSSLQLVLPAHPSPLQSSPTSPASMLRSLALQPSPLSADAMAACPMLRLAQVEHHLIMHYLDARSLLRFSRCSRRLMLISDNSFAWDYTSLTIDSNQQHGLGLIRTQRRVPIRLVWVVNGRFVHDLAVSALQDTLTLPLMQRLYELDASGCPRISTLQWRRILVHSHIQSLRILKTHRDPHVALIDIHVLRKILSLPHLHTLSIARVMQEDVTMLGLSQSESLWAEAPSLTSLDVNDSALFSTRKSPTLYKDQALLYQIAQCKKLKHLAVSAPSLYGNGWKNFFIGGSSSSSLSSSSSSSSSSQYMTQLHSLTLDWFHVVGHESSGLLAVPPNDYLDSFPYFKNLHALTLKSTFGIDVLLGYIYLIPVLQRLEIHPSTMENTSSNSSSAPSIASLLALFTSSKFLDVLIVLNHRCEMPSLQQQALGQKLKTMYQLSRLNELKEFGKRFKLEDALTATPAAT